jgi:large subunit ribosomal protein L24
MSDFSNTWNSSKNPGKQRKFRMRAPLHIKGNFLNAHLSKELHKKYLVRSIRIRTGDKVRILRGQYKKQDAKVEEVDVKKGKVFLSKIEHVKKDGSKARYPIHPSNLLITELNTDDKKRFKNLNVKKASGQDAISGSSGSAAKVGSATKTSEMKSSVNQSVKASAPKQTDTNHTVHSDKKPVKKSAADTANKFADKKSKEVGKS